MQRPIIFILILLSGINLFGQHLNEKKRDLRKKNKIEKVLTFRHHLATKDSIADGEETFDREGNTILDIRFNDKGKSRVRYVLEYANNLMVKQTMYDEKEQVTNFLVYRYDANGNQIEYKQLKPDLTVVNFQKRTYNQKNQNTELYNWNKDKDTTFFLSGKYYYNDFNNFLVNESYNPRKELVYKSEYEYDADQNLIRIYRTTAGKKELIRRDKYQNNLLIESEVNYEKQNTPITKLTLYQYDAEGNVIGTQIFENGVPVERLSYQILKFGS